MNHEAWMQQRFALGEKSKCSDKQGFRTLSEAVYAGTRKVQKGSFTRLPYVYGCRLCGNHHLTSRNGPDVIQPCMEIK